METRARQSALRMRDIPPAERPRERLLQCGADQLPNADLLAILLRTGVRGSSAIQVGQELLSRFGSLNTLARASIEELAQTRGVGRDKAIALKSAFTLAHRLAREVKAESPLLDTPESVANLLREEARLREVEHLQIILLNTRRRLIRIEDASTGTLDSLLIHPREVFRRAILANAAAIILAHNHPSGDPTPSEADIRVTRDLIRSGQLLKIEVLDHLILGRRTEQRTRDFVSLRELGYFA